MKTTTTYPLTLYYDAGCPVCALEMDHLRERDRQGRLRFVDISAPEFDAAALGVPFAELDAAIHAQRPDGTWLQGVQVLRLAYGAVGLGWVFTPAGWAPLSPLAERAYRLFARHRRRISRVAAPLIEAIRASRARRTHARMRACADGACAHGDEPGGRTS
jgi:predicted DCC family thiol-disulfide oxidoreductase YuxK